MARAGSGVALNDMTDRLEITRSVRIRPRSVMSAVVIPSAKASCVVSPDRLSSGNTATERSQVPPLFAQRCWRQPPTLKPMSSATTAGRPAASATMTLLLRAPRTAGLGSRLDAARACANSAAPAWRSAGTFANAFSTARSTPGETVSRTVRMGATGSTACRARIACAVGPVNGGAPVSISYTTQPRAYRSLRPSTPPSSVPCSGLMYAGVPSAIPVSVSRSLPAALIARAIPKSVTRARPSASRMFSGLMSRCTTPRLWA